ncbi:MULTISPECIES: alpha/beta hydrolase [Pantoea]|jgi:phospholipase/carboxylesterase|uniref:alpha/beta hydrolase n=1 Tax=Pantoea TaxID=53335 RepID=UPI000EA27CF1|nr:MULTISPECIES: prolyl oligopeptidase family serine peptidase [Pantoea]MBZ6386742.1 prolyl oligopeptidase family serine peptidase [Pantoea piersonii]MBZ6399580.1 prolyl oligopeptidase family serine peptidase [Pantoea piersonii]MBZ6408633.1 prolyl oligopeptidase family serine peptidase [Pantoea piersonii]MBZ6425599.1 prolyl oligopeptidase family serine peptidase [Pantoea piersonii]NYB03373.1 prolyl oligopeptidase family serine peptidase [Pantoea piersonii]
MAKALVIFLHGVGSNGEDLASLGHHWAPLLPDVLFAAPDAPFPFAHGAGFEWFSLDGVTPENRPARVRAARVAFDDTLEAILARHALRDAWEKVVLVGFSQGSIMALDALASGRFPLAGVVAFSGRLAFDEPLSPSEQTPALLIHGHADAVVPWRESESAAQRLKVAGVPLELQLEPRTEHTISPQGARRAAAFIAQCLQD